MKVFKISLLALVLGLTAISIHAQDRTQAVQLYNKGLEEAQSNNYDASISTFEQVITMANQMGPEGEDLKQNAEEQIPKMYFAKARDAYQSFQQSKDLEDLQTTINAFREVIAVSEEYGDTRYAPSAKGAIPQLYYSKSVLLYSQDDIAGAEEAVDQALNLNSNYAAAYYQKAKIFKKVNDTNDDGIIDQGIDDMLEWYDRAIQVGDATDKMNIANKAREAAHDELLAVGSKAITDGEINSAIETLTKALDYDNSSADVHYRLAEAYNKNNNAQQAIEHANQALELENGGRTDKAKIYFELGFAYQTLGNKANACDAFSNALYGSFRAPAEHKMEFELKCDSTAK